MTDEPRLPPLDPPHGTQVMEEGGRRKLLAHRLRLLVVAGPDEGQSVDLPGPHLVLGTAANCDVRLSDRTVSRHHCELTARDGAYVLRDLGSTNGTFVAGLRVVEALLEPGTRIQLGDTELLFEPKKKWVRVDDSSGAGFGELAGASAPMRALFGLLERVAPTKLSCLVLGETGAGKEVAARSIHQCSGRAAGPFLVVDCAAVSPSLVEAELFGHERGAFTGADRARPGAFELASGGTVFLDEIGELGLDLQPKLLRVLERREVKRLGSSQLVDVDVRVVAATHRRLDEMVAAGTFREDLYFRIAEVVVELPPLRARVGDLPALVDRLLVEEGLPDGAAAFTPDASALLQGHPFPGNVRELRSVLRRLLALGGRPSASGWDRAVVQRALGAGAAQGGPSRPLEPATARAAPSVADCLDLPLREARERWVSAFEREYLRLVLEATDGDHAAAAARAGVHVKSLQRLLREHRLGER